MFNCHEDLLAHHDEDVTLPSDERDEMRKRRNSNRDRLKKGLAKAGKPSPLEFKSQGSYAMKTMVQHHKLDYDIDDGVYFAKESLVGPRGAEMSSLDARNMVRDAIDDGSFAKAPEVRKNCVRVYYSAGYHVDLPVYRRVTTKDFLGQEQFHYELASSDWKRSDARDVTAWFEKENTAKSPDTGNGRQVRRTTRQIKYFARSRDSWSGRILSGFAITKLVTEEILANIDREDKALYDTMKAIRDRLKFNQSVSHPCTPNETITNDPSDPKAVFLHDKLTDAIDTLEPLFETDCTREKALKAWDKAFGTTFFTDRLKEETSKSTSASIITSGLFKSSAADAAAAEAVRKEGGGRYA